MPALLNNRSSRPKLSLTAANRSRTAPGWLTRFATVATKTAGVGVPPLVVLWLIVALFAGLILRRTIAGRRVYLTGLVLFAVSSLCCGLAPNVGVLIAARGVQGVGAAAMFATTMALISNTYTGPITLQITGLTNGETVIIQKYIDLDANGVVDAGDILWQQFQLTDGQASVFTNGTTSVMAEG